MRFEPFEVTEESWHRRMDELRFRHGKWDLNVDGRATVARGALVLEPAEHAAIVQAAEALYALSLEAQAGPAPVHDPVLAELAEADRPRPFLTRIDFFPTREGWRVSEFNDDAPGGHNEAVGLPAVLGDLANGKAPGDLAAAVARIAPWERAGIAYATGYAEDLQVVRLLASMLPDPDPVLASPAHLERRGRGWSLLGRRVDGVLRFFPGDWFRHLPGWRLWRDAVAGGLPVVNPFTTARTQPKSSFAWLRPRAPAALRGLLPETRPLDGEAVRLLLDDPAAWVLKPAHGRMGEGVTVGAACPPAAWAKRVRAAARARGSPFVAQSRFHAVPVEVAPGTALTPCIGAYVAGGRFAGYYTRLAAGPVVAYHATNVLTVVAPP